MYACTCVVLVCKYSICIVCTACGLLCLPDSWLWLTKILCLSSETWMLALHWQSSESSALTVLGARSHHRLSPSSPALCGRIYLWSAQQSIGRRGRSVHVRTLRTSMLQQSGMKTKNRREWKLVSEICMNRWRGRKGVYRCIQTRAKRNMSSFKDMRRDQMTSNDTRKDDTIWDNIT